MRREYFCRGVHPLIADASGEGISVGDKTVEYGTTSVVLPLSLVGVYSVGGTFGLSCDYPLKILSISGWGGVAKDILGTSAGVAVDTYGELSDDFGSVTIGIADGAEPGTYPVNITVRQLDENGSDVENPVGYSGSVTIIAKGDISGNGKIDLYDAIEICKSLMGMRTFTSEEKGIADYDGNGKVDLYDAIGIAKKLLEK